MLDISLNLDEYNASEADRQMVIFVCIDKQIQHYSKVEVAIAPVTFDNATVYEESPQTFILIDDPNSPNRAGYVSCIIKRCLFILVVCMQINKILRVISVN